MIVATGACDRQTHESASGHVNLLVHEIHLEFRHVSVVERLRTHGQKARGHQTVIARLSGKQIPRQLFPNKLIKRLILVERLDDVIPEPPSVRKRCVSFHAIALRISSDVQPTPSPAHPELGTCKQAIDYLLVSIRLVIGKKPFKLVGTGWQTGQVEEHPADQGCLVRIRSRPQTFRLQARFDKSVDWRAGPLAVTQFGFRTFKRPKGPKFLSLLNVDLILDHSLARPWVRGAHPDPVLKDLDDVCGKFLLRGHLQIFVFPVDRFDKQAFFQIPGHDGRA